MSRRWIGNFISTVIALAIGGAAFYAFYHFLSPPRPFTADNYWGPAMDWAQLVCAGVTVGIIFFFIAWGHFQTPADRGQPSQEATDLPSEPRV